MPKVSVIVPIFGVEACLDKCVESILHQTYTDWELILVDDGSPDRSGTICDEWAERDKRIMVFHKENGGVSSARNLGIEKAKGAWITFVDADDAIDPQALEKCANFFDKADVIRFSMKYIYSEDGKEFKDFVLPVLTHDEYIARIVARETILGVCGGFYLRKTFIENNIRFDTSLVNGEDWVVLLQLVLLAKDLTILPDAFYFYNKSNEDSCTYTSNFEKSYSAISALDKIHRLLNEEGKNGFDDSFSRAKCQLGYYFYTNLIVGSFKVTREELKKYATLIGITKKDIVKGAHSFKECILLLCICNRLGQKFLRKYCII